MLGIPVFLVSENPVFRQIMAEKEGFRASELCSLACPSSQAPRQMPVSRPQDACLFDICLSQGSNP